MNRVRVQIRLGQLEQSGHDLDQIELALAIHHPEQQQRLIQAQLLRAEWQAAAGLADQARATMASIDPDFVTSQAPDSRFAQRWEALLQSLQ